MRRRALAPCAAALVVAAMLACATVRAQVLEHAVKATFVYKLAAFVEWPAESFASPYAPLVICVTGGDPVSALVDDAARGQALGLRPIVVRRVSTPAQAANCHVVFIGARSDAESYLRTLRGKPVFTITDEADDMRAKGVVNFVVRDSRVRLEIDLDKAAQQNLALSSKLASLAVNVLPPR